MPTINVPLGSEIKESKKDVIKLKVPNSRFYIIGKKTNNLWETFIYNSKTKEKRNLKHTLVTTQEFSTIANVILRTPLPYQGKEKSDITLIRKFIRKIITKNK